VGTSASLPQIANVGNGKLDNDTVNVSQLQNVTTLLGGGAKVNPDGTIKAPSYTVATAKFATLSEEHRQR
jgi:hypothetical protein